MARRIDYKVQLHRIRQSIEDKTSILEELQTRPEALTEEEQGQVKDLSTHIDDYSRYLAILTCGYLEVCTKEITEDYFYHNSPAASAYIVNTWPRSRNMWFDVMVDLLKNIDEAKGDAFKAATKDDFKEHVDQLVEARNKIAHGASLTVVPTDVLVWLAKAEGIVEQYELHLNAT